MDPIAIFALVCECRSKKNGSGDSVSPIIITANDVAAGWASDPDDDSLYSLLPGGERQHELALRGGVNLVIYTLPAITNPTKFMCATFWSASRIEGAGLASRL